MGDQKKKKEKKKGPHLFWDEKLGKFSKIRTVHPEKTESSSRKLGKIRKVTRKIRKVVWKIRKVLPEN